MHADEREDVDSAEAGDIIAVVGVDCASGDTFCGGTLNYALESIYVPEPVIRLSIEPLKRDGADRLSKALERFRREGRLASRRWLELCSDPSSRQSLPTKPSPGGCFGAWHRARDGSCRQAGLTAGCNAL